MNFKFTKTSLSDILTVAEWHKNETVFKWIRIDDWVSYYNTVTNAPDYYLYSIFSRNVLAALVAGEIIDRYLTMYIIVDPDKHGQGLGTRILSDMRAKTEELFCDIKGYIANIYPNNLSSKRCFEKAGFRYEKDGDDGEMIYRFELLNH